MSLNCVSPPQFLQVEKVGSLVEMSGSSGEKGQGDCLRAKPDRQKSEGLDPGSSGTARDRLAVLVSAPIS